MVGTGFGPGETPVIKLNLPSSARKYVCLSQWRPNAAAKRTVVTVLLLHSQLMLCIWRRSHGHRKRIASADDMRPPRCRRRGLNLLAAIERAETLSFIPVFLLVADWWMRCSSEPAARCPHALRRPAECSPGSPTHISRVCTATGVGWLDEVTTGRRWPISDARPAQAMRIPSLLPMTDLGCGSAGVESDKTN